MIDAPRFIWNCATQFFSLYRRLHRNWKKACGNHAWYHSFGHQVHMDKWVLTQQIGVLYMKMKENARTRKHFVIQCYVYLVLLGILLYLLFLVYLFLYTCYPCYSMFSLPVTNPGLVENYSRIDKSFWLTLFD